MDLSISIWIYRYRYVEFLTSCACHDISIRISIFLGWRSFRYDFFPFFNCDQSALKTLISVCPSVCLYVRLSARHTFLTMFLSSYHPEIIRNRIILKFSVITIDRRDVHAKGQGQRPKVKVTEVMTPLNNFRTVTPVWIHIWQWNDAQSLMLLRRGALLFYKVIRQISRSHG